MFSRLWMPFSAVGAVSPASDGRSPFTAGSKRFTPLSAALATLALAFANPAYAVDHDNLDASRPLRIEDAESIALGERAFEYGLAPTWPRSSRSDGLGLGLSGEFLWGFALNSHVSLDFDPYIGAWSQSRDKRFDLNNVGVGVLHNFNRETLSTPAFGLRLDTYLPTGRGERGANFRVRGILSRTTRQYSRVHVNLDANFATNPGNGERSFRPAATVGVSRPFGYPTRFDRTVLAEVGTRVSDENGRGFVFYTGAGVRQQVTPRSVVDLGITSDFAATKTNASRDDLRLVAGYSTQF